MSIISSSILDAAQAYLHTASSGQFDPLTSDSGWIVQRLKDWGETQGWGRNDVMASDIAIHLAQRAGRAARTATGTTMRIVGSVGQHIGVAEGPITITMGTD